MNVSNFSICDCLFSSRYLENDSLSASGFSFQKKKSRTTFENKNNQTNSKFQGVIIKSNYFGESLRPNEMFRDDLWWNSAVPEIESKSNRRIEVKPNPMLLKAEQIFRDALKK